MGFDQNVFCRGLLVVAIAMGISACSDYDMSHAPIVSDSTIPLAKIEYSLGIGLAISPLEYVELEISYSESNDDVSLGVLTVRNGVEGSVVEFGPEMSETYDVFLSMMNNGDDEMLHVEARYGSEHRGIYSSDHLESQRLIERIGNSVQPDMIETPVTRVEAWLEKVSIEVPGRDPNGDGNWADVVIKVVYFLY